MLYKNVINTLKRRGLQIVLLAIIIAMSSLIYVSMTYSIQAIKAPTEAYLKAYVQEDFNVTIMDTTTEDEVIFFGLDSSSSLRDLFQDQPSLFASLIERRKESFVNQFSQTLIEERLYKDIYKHHEGTQHTIRVIRDANQINQSFITEGRKPIAENEIVLNETYAKANGWFIGESMDLLGQTYHVTGYVLFPDFTLAIFGDTLIINSQTRGLAMVSQASFDQLEGLFGIYFAGIIQSGSYRDEDFKAHHLPFVLHIQSTINTMRSGAIYEELKGGEGMGLVLSLVIALMAVFIIALMIVKILNEQRGAIGVLKALGYRNHEIMAPYLFFILAISIPGLLIGYALGFWLAEPLKTLYGSIYLLPNAVITHQANVIITSLIMPSSVLLLLGFFVIRRILSVRPLGLIQPVIQPPRPIKRTGFAFGRKSLLNRMKSAYITRNPVRFMVFAMGIFTSIYMILLSLSMVGVMDDMTKRYFENTDYHYLSYCMPQDACPLETIQYDRMIELPFVKLNQQPITLVGLDANNAFHPLYQKNKNITSLLEQPGIIITRSLQIEHRYKVGDIVSLSYGGINVRLKVLGIQEEYGASKAYINREALSFLLTEGLSKDYYHVILTQEKPSQHYLMTIDMKDLQNQSQDLSQMGDVMSYVLIIGSLGIGMAIFIIIMLLSLESNLYDISLFKVIGYNDSEIHRVFIRSYLSYVLMIFIGTVPIAFLSFEALTWYLVSLYGLVFPMTLTVYKLVIGLVLSLILYTLSVPIAVKKLRSISLQEALKRYQC